VSPDGVSGEPRMKSQEEPRVDNRRSRSQATQRALMRAAEKLIAEKGIENVSIRDIVNAAGQKNESALQYHFTNFQGLIRALHASRDAEIRAKRTAHLERLRQKTSHPSLREICKLMVEPEFELARSHPDFRRYVRAFGHEITLTDKSALAMVSRKSGQSLLQTGGLLREAFAHLDETAFQRRLDGALRFISAAMVHHARQKNAFRGVEAALFFSSLIDALAGLLSAPESDETQSIARSLNRA